MVDSSESPVLEETCEATGLAAATSQPFGDRFYEPNAVCDV